MIFYRSPAAPERSAKPSLARMRIYTTLALIAFPLGLLIGRLDSSGPVGSFEAWLGVALAATSAALMILSFFLIFRIVSSPLQRIVADEQGKLDEMEVQLRQRALSWSYGTVSGLMLLMIIYAALSGPFGLRMPASYEEWSGVFWWVFVIIILTPTAFLAWTMDPLDDEDQ